MTKFITENRKAFHDYSIENREVAGLVLEGWEVKSIRASRVQLRDAYISARGSELYIVGANISPLLSTSTHVVVNPKRDRKLLLTRRQAKKMVEAISTAGYTAVPLNLQFVNGKIKCEIGLAKGKKQYDKRHAELEKDVARELEITIKQVRTQSII
jgi:SsrA-binding protein